MVVSLTVQLHTLQAMMYRLDKMGASPETRIAAFGRLIAMRAAAPPYQTKPRTSTRIAALFSKSDEHARDLDLTLLTAGQNAQERQAKQDAKDADAVSCLLMHNPGADGAA